MFLTINGLHIRYEDDYYSDSQPFAFGLISSHISSYMVNNEWHFDSIESTKFSRRVPRDNEGLAIREINIKDIKIYWKSPAEMIIPLSLYESTKDEKNKIFEAISVEDMCSMMKQSFAEDYFIEQFSAYLSIIKNTRSSAIEEARNNKRAKTKIYILLTKVIVNITPQLIESLSLIKEHSANYSILNELKVYIPKKRPITSIEEIRKTEASIGIEALKRKRRLIVRDWFFLVVWAIRIKKIIGKYNKLMLQNKRPESRTIVSQRRQLMEGAKQRDRSVEGSNIGLNNESSNETSLSFTKNYIIRICCDGAMDIRVQELTINFYSSDTNLRQTNNKRLPSFQVILFVLHFHKK